MEHENHTNNLTGILDTLCETADENGEQIRMDAVLGALRHRGFGALLIAPSLLIVLPTGAIPGVPAICGIFMFLVSGQMLFGKTQPWVPQRLRDYAFDAARFKGFADKVRPYTEKVDATVKNRFARLARNDVSKRIVALTSMILTVAVISIGFIPFAPALLALPILFFALGLSVHDGLFLLLGYAAMVAGAVGVYVLS